MKTLKELLYITEEVNPTKWILSWKRPDFQVESEYESNEISEFSAKLLLAQMSCECRHDGNTWSSVFCEECGKGKCGNCIRQHPCPIKLN